MGFWRLVFETLLVGDLKIQRLGGLVKQAVVARRPRALWEGFSAQPFKL